MINGRLKKKSGIKWEMWILPTSTESLKFSSYHCSWRGQVSAILGMYPHLFGPSLSRLVQGNKDAWWPSFTLWDHTMQTNRKFSASWSAGSLSVPVCLGTGGNAWTSELIILGKSALLCMYLPYILWSLSPTCQRHSRDNCLSDIL